MTSTPTPTDLPEALRHAEAIEHWARCDNGLRGDELRAGADELRRLHALAAPDPIEAFVKESLTAAQPQAGAESYPPSEAEQVMRWLDDNCKRVGWSIDTATYEITDTQALRMWGAAALRARGAVPSDDVQAKIDSNTWDHFGDILPTLNAISRGDWYWGANNRCKYIEIRLDTRDGGCILYDRERVRISPAQFAFQDGGGCGKMESWPARNQVAAPQPPAALPGAQDARDAARYRYLEPLLTKHQWCGAGYEYARFYIENPGRLEAVGDAIDAAMAAAKGRTDGGGSNG